MKICFATEVTYHSYVNRIKVSSLKDFLDKKLYDFEISYYISTNMPNEFSEYESNEYIKVFDVENLRKENIKSKVHPSEIEDLNNILIKNGVNTIKSFNIDNWFNFWFKIFHRKSNIYLKNSQRIIDEVMDKYKHWEGYSTIPNDGKIIDYSPYIKKFDIKLS